MAAIFLRPCHADPAARAELPAEFAAAAGPGSRAIRRRHGAERVFQERAHFAAQRFGFRRQVVWREVEGRHCPSERSLWRSGATRANLPLRSGSAGSQRAGATASGGARHSEFAGTARRDVCVAWCRACGGEFCVQALRAPFAPILPRSTPAAQRIFNTRLNAVLNRGNRELCRALNYVGWKQGT